MADAEPQVLHFKDYTRAGYGPCIRMCTECAVRLWIAKDGVWTDDRRVFESPPEGYVNCREARAARS